MLSNMVLVYAISIYATAATAVPYGESPCAIAAAAVPYIRDSLCILVAATYCERFRRLLTRQYISYTCSGVFFSYGPPIGPVGGEGGGAGRINVQR